MAEPAYTLDQGVALIRRIQPTCMAAGWYVALAGGVLNNGSSDTDLDLVFMPRREDSKRFRLIMALEREIGVPGKSDLIPGGVHVTFPAFNVEGTIVNP